MAPRFLNDPASTVETFVEELRTRWPLVVISVSSPASPSGEWFIDMTLEGKAFVIQYRHDLGFGLSSLSSEGYGQGPDEYKGARIETVVERIEYLLTNGHGTRPTRDELVRAIRHLEKAAQRSEITNLENLQRCIKAVGGELQVKVGSEVIPISVMKAAG